jgi:hypothetical protein
LKVYICLTETLDLWFHIWNHIWKILLTQIEKLIQVALKNPQNLRFSELCKLCEFFGMEKRGSEGSHVIYKRKTEPRFALSIQDNNGKAKKYQVEQLINKIKEYDLFRF